MLVTVVNKPWDVPSYLVNEAVLLNDNWNDYGFYTTFSLFVFDDQGKKHEMGLVQIAFKGQEDFQNTYSMIDKKFENLDKKYFSVGGGTDYYNSFNKLPEVLRKRVLVSLRDIVYNVEIIEEIIDEKVFEISLLRNVSLTTIKNQYRRVLGGEAALTKFEFKFIRENMKGFSDISLDFEVHPESKPKTNIHVLIGRNGIGKTTILNGMIDSVIGNNSENQRFMTKGFFEKNIKIDNDYFSRIVSVSFSAFDPFKPHKQQDDPTKGTCYSYIGLKNNNKEGLKEISTLYDEFVKALVVCVHKNGERWLSAIKTLESDSNFSEMNLKDLANATGDVLREEGLKKIKNMSSGHAVVLITLTLLVATVEEKTLVLIDEPESHLHPPLLSAFVRALSNLLTSRNGIAIIATHSPVVLQEVPKSCAWKISRYGSVSTTIRPKIETFGENVGVLTRDVFGLEVENSGFYHLLKNSVESGKGFNEIMADYNQQLGVEGRLILANLVASAEKRKIDAKDS